MMGMDKSIGQKRVNTISCLYQIWVHNKMQRIWSDWLDVQAYLVTPVHKGNKHIWGQLFKTMYLLNKTSYFFAKQWAQKLLF